MTIAYSHPPCGTCPVQAEGEIDGLPFYFRSRSRHWALYVATYPGGDPLADDALFHREEYADPGDYAASYAPPDKCVEFIEKAAAILAESRQSLNLTKP